MQESFSDTLAQALDQPRSVDDWPAERQVVLDCLLKGQVHMASWMDVAGAFDAEAEVTLIGFNRPQLADAQACRQLLGDLRAHYL